jgi:hypothetical protein
MRSSPDGRKDFYVLDYSKLMGCEPPVKKDPPSTQSSLAITPPETDDECFNSLLASCPA